MAHKTSVNIILSIGCLAGLAYAVYITREHLARQPQQKKIETPDLEFVRELDPQYEVFEKDACTLEDIDNWTARAIKIRHDDRVYQFRLYFVETPPNMLTESTQPLLRAQAEYFGDPPIADLMERGDAANEFVRRTLTEQPFKIITRFEPERGSKSLYAFIQVDTKENIRKYLSAILVRNGLASVTARSSHTPFGQNMLDFREHLVEEREAAINDRSGVWEDSRLAQKLEEMRKNAPQTFLET